MRQYTNKEIWGVSYPILLSLLAQNVINVTDTAFLGHVGEVALGAAAMGGLFYICIFTVAFGFSTGSQILIARRNGERNYTAVGPVMIQGMMFLLLMALLMFLFSKMFGGSIVRLLVSSEAIYEGTMEFLDWRVYGFFFSFASVIFRAFYIGVTRTKVLTLNAFIMAITNVVRSISGLVFMVVAAFASTCSALVSNLIGAGHEDAVMPTIRKHVGLVFLIVLPMVALFALFPRMILGVYTNIPDLITASIPSLWVYCTTPLLIAPGNIYFQAVSGTGNTRMAFMLELATLCVYTLYIYVIIQHLRFDVAWCWTSEHVYGLCIFVACYAYMRRGRWRLGRI